MNSRTTAPKRWWYLIGALLGVIGLVACGVLATVQLYSVVPALRFVAPGTHEMYLPKAGRYKVFYESHSVIDGKTYSTGAYPSSMSVRIGSFSTEPSVKMWADSGSTTYTTPKYTGTSIMEFSVDRPGTYVLGAQYADSGNGPQVVLAVGRINGLALALKMFGIVVGGLAITGVGVLVLMWTFLKRRKAAEMASRFASGGPSDR